MIICNYVRKKNSQNRKRIIKDRNFCNKPKRKWISLIRSKDRLSNLSRNELIDWRKIFELVSITLSRTNIGHIEIRA